MSSAPTATNIPPPHEPSPLAAFLSYLIPGLGQIYQRRYGKGLLFMISLLGMFYLGQGMGQFQNVFFAPPSDRAGGVGRGGAMTALINRWHFGGQFLVCISALPAPWPHYQLAL